MTTNFSKYERDPDFEKKYNEWRKQEPNLSFKEKRTEEGKAKILQWLDDEPTCVKKVKK